jgi:tricorn protease
MQQTFRGHLVVLADEYTYSDGETFTAAVKALNLAPIIGKRTAGAGVWLRGRNLLADKGVARVAEFPVYAMDGRWINEGHGVIPTIEVNNLPHATFLGEDAQLEAAIKYLKEKLKNDPVPEMEVQPFPSNVAPAEDIVE